VTVYAVEADVVRDRRLWPRGLIQPPLTDADKAYLAAAASVETRRREQRIDTEFADEDERETKADHADDGAGRPVVDER
jgi:hypothetical protein